MKEINIKIENKKKRKEKQVYRKCNVKTDRIDRQKDRENQNKRKRRKQKEIKGEIGRKIY